MKKFIKYINGSIRPPLIALLMVFITVHAIGQVQTPLSPKFKSIAKPESVKGWIDFREGTTVNPSTMFTDLKDAFELKEGDEMRVKKTEQDTLGFTHYRYQQYYKNFKVIYGEYAVHRQANGFVKSANGRVVNGLTLGNIPSVSEKSALAAALSFMNAGKYLWQNPAMEKELKRQEKDDNATYYPKGELVYAPHNDKADFAASEYRLAWQFKIYTDDAKVAAKIVYVDALTGQVIHSTDLSMSCSGGTGTSTFNGTVSINTQASVFGLFVSHNDCQATNIYVYNCNGGSAANNLYYNAGNSWSDQSAVQAQFGAMKTYDYYLGQHGRQSWNGAAGDMIAYNNSNQPGLGVNNACWGCTGNSAIFGAGSTSSATDDWNSDDIMGHEFTHGVTQSTAGLVYSNESGALNESFSDIFGEMVESWTEGSCDYLVGADRGAIRSFINPNSYSDYGGVMPDTYLGTGWYSGIIDHGGVHHNSSVQNHWFYLLSEGGTGTNDFGQAYNVTGISRFKARLIAYRALTVYLNSSSQYIDARKASLEAAWDLYGGCSPEIIAVGDAWHAVGVESQSQQFAKNICGTYPASGTFLQAISQLTAANGCNTEITPSATTVYFTARDQVILYPGFKAVNGSNFVAYLDPCSSTMWRSSKVNNAGIIMSDAEKGIKNPVTIQTPKPPVELKSLLNDKESISISPNPFRSNFEVSIISKQDIRGTVNVFNSLGVKVREITTVNFVKGFNKISLNGAGLVNGVYLIEVYMGSIKMVKKIVKI